MDSRIAQNKVVFGYLMVILSAIGFGSYGVWSKNIGNDFGVFTQGWVRSLIVLLLLLPIGLLTKQFKAVRKSDWRRIAVPVLFGVFTQAPIYYAYNKIPIGTATLIFFGSFLITTYFYGYVFIGENIDKAKKLALALAITGLFATFGIEFAALSLAALSLAALSGIASGAEVASTKKVTKKLSSLQISVFIWLGILISHLPAAVISGEKFVKPEFNEAWASMLAYSLVGLLSFWFVVEGFKHIDASIGGLLGLLEVVFAVIFGVILFNEKIGPSTIVGGGLIIIAAMLPDLADTYQQRQNRSTNNTKYRT